MGSANALATQASPNFTISSVADRALDLVAAKGFIALSSNGNTIAPDKILIQRGLNPTTGSSLGALDFAGAGVVPATANVTVANLIAGDSINIGTTFRTATGTKAVVNVFQTAAATSTVYSVPPAQFIAGDLHELLVQTYPPDFNTGRYHYSYLSAVTDHTEALAPALTSPSVTVLATSPYARMVGHLPAQPEYPTLAEFVFFQDGGTAPDRIVFALVSAAYLGAAPSTSWTVSIPDFGAVAGLNVNWLPSSTLLTYYVEADGGPGLALFGGPPAAGDILRWAFRYGTTGSLLRTNARGLTARLRDGGPRQYLRR